MKKIVSEKNQAGRICKFLITVFFVVVLQGAAGCKTSMEVEAADPDFIEREGWAFTRLVTSPINILGPTVATYNHIYTSPNWHPVGSVLITPFVPFLTVPAGSAVACTDAFIGMMEIMTTLHFHKVSFPWESYNYENVKWWNYGTAVAMVCFCAGATFSPPLALLALFIPLPDQNSTVPIANPHVAAAVSAQLAASAAAQPIISAPTPAPSVSSTPKVRARTNYSKTQNTSRTGRTAPAYYTCSKHTSNRIAVVKTCALCAAELVTPRAPRFAH